MADNVSQPLEPKKGQTIAEKWLKKLEDVTFLAKVAE